MQTQIIVTKVDKLKNKLANFKKLKQHKIIKILHLKMRSTIKYTAIMIQANIKIKAWMNFHKIVVLLNLKM